MLDRFQHEELERNLGGELGISVLIPLSGLLGKGTRGET